MDSDPNPMPEFRLFRFERLRNTVDFVMNIGHLLVDQVRSSTPTEKPIEEQQQLDFERQSELGW